jgi:GTP-binding protein EngB required for normal cell division
VIDWPDRSDIGVVGVLREVAGLATELGVDHLPAEAAALTERLVEGRFFVACVGQFKRGKSTLLNALVGDPILPTGVAPVTTVVTLLRHRPRRTARVRLAGADWREIDPAELSDYVTEAQNPENEKGVAGVEVFLPSPLLASGMCLVDTPGIGSVFAGNTEVTREFVPHVDAALVVLGADPPISGDELALVQEVTRHTAHLILVLNKADRLSAAERAEARWFTERVLAERLSGLPGPIFEISAIERLGGEPTRDWTALEHTLETLARDSGRALVRAAAERGVRRLADRLLQVLDAHRAALVRPLEESERRVAALRLAVAEAERALNDLSPLFTAEQERLARALDAERRRFLTEALPQATRELAQRVTATEGHRRGALRARAIEHAREVARTCVEAWRRDFEPRAETLYRQATARFAELVNGFLARFRATGDPALAGLPADLGPETAFRAPRHFYFADLLVVASAPPIGWLVTRLAPRRAALAAVRRDAQAYLERLMTTNSARVANDLVDRVVESRRQLEAEIGGLLTEVVTAAEHAVAQARTRQQAGAGAVQAEFERLDALRRRVEAIRADIGRA